MWNCIDHSKLAPPSHSGIGQADQAENLESGWSVTIKTSSDEESQNSKSPDFVLLLVSQLLQPFGVETIQTISIKPIMTNMTIETSFGGLSVGRLG